MKDRLYYQDPYLTEFETVILEIKPQPKNLFALRLKETAFYPTSGGQPHDTGCIDGIKVLDVTEEGADIWHIVEERPKNEVVHCQIDWARRFDFMQQHAGQHLLSEAFLIHANAMTIGFHLTEDNLTIDLDIAKISEEQILAAEETVNRIIWENRPIKKHWVAPEDLASLPLRKQPKVDSNIRIVEMGDYDWVPCGGTHPNFTGEVGIVKIRRWERSKAVTRVEFFCGNRALEDYRWKNDLVLKLADGFSVKDRELGEAVLRLQERLKETDKKLVDTEARLLQHEAQALRRGAYTNSNFSIVKKVLPASFEAADLRKLVLVLLEEEQTVALLINQEENPKYTFAVSKELGLDLRIILAPLQKEFGAKGGGSPFMVQGSLLRNEDTQPFLEAFSTAIENYEIP